MKNAIISRQAEHGLAQVQQRSGFKLTPAAQQELLRLERTLLEQGSLAEGAEPSDQLLKRSQRVTPATKSNIRRVGILYCVHNQLFVASIPCRENPTYAGFRTFGVGHYEHYGDLVESGTVPPGAYWAFPRGRVSYHDGTRRFILLADRCIVRSKRLKRTILELFNLPSSTTILADSHYSCDKCNPRTEPPELGYLDYNWDDLISYLNQIGAH